MSSSSALPSTHFAFYVSSHGFGHCTRASALSAALLARGHQVTIVTNAAPGPFSAVLQLGGNNLTGKTALYRKRDVDPGMLQPKAYDVARQGTVDLLTAFLAKRTQTLEEEVAWLREAGVGAVLSDATFLGCAAAAHAGIPAILASNFSFDSCFSYLAHPTPASLVLGDDEPEEPIPAAVLDPLVAQVVSDYYCASLLLRLPGAIPIPAFDTDAALPSGQWVTPACESFTDHIEKLLSRSGDQVPTIASGLPPGVTPEFASPHWPKKRKVVDVPLVVRPPNKDVYGPDFRRKLLSSMDVPEHLHSHKILLVSFGGQNIPRPRSRPPSPLSSPLLRASSAMSAVGSLDGGILGGGSSATLAPPRIAQNVGLLPEGWIALVCGLTPSNSLKDDMPDNFFGAPLDCHVPDLTATADVVLGKLGYGTCSETLSVHTPMVYVPRPLFIEEHGLRRLMVSQGTCLALQREDFEAGRWALHVLEAWECGKELKEKARKGWVDVGAAEMMVREIENFLAELSA